jgi:hypothetical protein
MAQRESERKRREGERGGARKREEDQTVLVRRRPVHRIGDLKELETRDEMARVELKERERERASERASERERERERTS